MTSSTVSGTPDRSEEPVSSPRTGPEGTLPPTLLRVHGTTGTYPVEGQSCRERVGGLSGVQIVVLVKSVPWAPGTESPGSSTLTGPRQTPGPRRSKLGTTVRYGHVFSFTSTLRVRRGPLSSSSFERAPGLPRVSGCHNYSVTAPD